MKRIFWIALSVGLAILLSSTGTYGAALDIDSAFTAKATARQYELYEMAARIHLPYKNPNDTDEIDLSVNITTPDGENISIPGFYSGQESLWKVRYTPVKAGKFGCQLILKTPLENYISKVRYFKVLPTAKDGFVRKGRNNPYYPVHDSGKPFIGLGHNIAWGNIPVYERYFVSFRENGLNLTRVWLNSPWTFFIEKDRVGIYDASESDKVDTLLALAEKYGVYIILTLNSYSSLMDERGSWGEQCWNINPFNKANMGPCEKPDDFFTNESAKRYYRKWLRYAIARWGYSPNIIAFELWNEMDAPPEWTKEMAAYIKSINPHGQFVTTSLDYPYTNNFDESSIWRLDEIDIIDRHVYGNKVGDPIGNIISLNNVLSEKYKKLIVVGEFGIDGSQSDIKLDKSGSGAALHASLWASILTRSFAGALHWWWEEYVNAMNLYPHYKAVRNFVRDVDWDSRNVAPIKTTPICYSDKAVQPRYSDVDIPTRNTWGDTAYSEFTAENNGEISGGVLNMYLHGVSKKGFRLEPVFHVNYPADGRFMVHVDTVSQGAQLIIYLDDKVAFKKELAAVAGEGPWKKSVYSKQYDIYQCVYDDYFGIDVPKGKHTLRLANTGQDWISIKNITLVNYMDSSIADARIVGLALDNEMLLWIQNKDWNWRNDLQGKPHRLIKYALFRIQDVIDGLYNIEWWDTFKGVVISARSARAEGGELTVTIPDFDKDIACKIARVIK